jgi:NADPH:quinone reductase-like Zn-dependent oxidoreductase
MRAVIITSHGGIDGIGVQEIEQPAPPTADRVQVRVRAAGLNRADIMQREGNYPPPPGYPENIPGLEFAGEVEAVGDAVRSWEIGDRVFGITGGGAQAEFVVVPESNLARIPEELDWNEAAATPEEYVSLTASGWQDMTRIAASLISCFVNFGDAGVPSAPRRRAFSSLRRASSAFGSFTAQAIKTARS